MKRKARTESFKAQPLSSIRGKVDSDGHFDPPVVESLEGLKRAV